MGFSLQDPASARTRLNRRIAALSLRRPRPWDVEGSALGRGQGVIAALLFLAAPAPPSECAGSWKLGGWNRAHLGGARCRLRRIRASAHAAMVLAPPVAHRLGNAGPPLACFRPTTAASPPPSRHQLRPSRSSIDVLGQQDGQCRPVERIDVACDSGVIVHDQRLCLERIRFHRSLRLSALHPCQCRKLASACTPAKPHRRLGAAACSGPDRCFAQPISIYI
jgi:hypothetical protein